MRWSGRLLWLMPALACGEGPPAPTAVPAAPQGLTADLEIITTATGPGVDSTGYDLTLNGVAYVGMTTEDTLRLLSVPPADYLIGLTAVAPHCKVGGGNPRRIRVPPGVTTRVIFVVKCDPSPGPATS